MCGVLCIVCIVFLFPLLFMYSSRLRTNAAWVARAGKQKKVAFAPPRGCNFLFRVVGVLPSPRFSAFELDASVFRFSVRPFVSFVSHIVRYASSLRGVL